MNNSKKNNKIYDNPLISRYSSAAMSYIFSPDYKFTTWRRLWIALAESQKELGLPISQEQIDEMRLHADDIDYDTVESYESKFRHDVMAHLYAFGSKCPSAKPIIHLGATSAFVGDNTDLIQMREAVKLLLRRLTRLMDALRIFSITHKDLPTLGYTHFQPAQLTTVGKRAALWLFDISMDFRALISFQEDLPFRSVKGTTGTQASFLSLFEGDNEAVKQLDKTVAKKMGFDTVLPVTGQTYTRKIDSQIAYILSGLSQSLHKFANDIRLLQHLREIEEPFEKDQIGSSAMAYKRNPMRTERLTSLARYTISLSSSPAMTAAEQWFERTLDDSANKRLSIPQAFLAADAMLILAENISRGLVVYPHVITKRILEELPFMATENIIMEAVKKGGDRQELHERIRVHSVEAAKQLKLHGKKNDLLDRIISDTAFKLSKDDLERILDINKFIGRAPQQTEEFIREHIDPLIKIGNGFGPVSEEELHV